MVVIRLQRTGKPKQAYYRLVAIDRTKGSTGRPLEILGSYNPRGETPAKKLQLQKERYDSWVKNGAQPSQTVATLVRSSDQAAPEKKS